MNKSKKVLSLLLSLLLVISIFPSFDITVTAVGNAPRGNFITFSSASPFTINATKIWEGTLQYSTNGTSWATYAGGTDLTAARIGSSGDYYLCFRGTGNTLISGRGVFDGDFSPWVITGTAVACSGNIETLLDYTTVAQGNHPTMGNYCFFRMFYNCPALTTAPSLTAVTLSDYCYSNMFYNCKSLSEVPVLPATVMAAHCYENMFYNCIALTALPVLPAATLATSCYNSMFSGCSGIKIYASAEEVGAFPMKWSVPAGATAEGTINWNSSMFFGTGGSYTRAPVIGTEYYYEVAETPFVVFSGTTSFTINTEKKWNGTLECSTDGVNWAAYEGGTNLTAEKIGTSRSFYLCFRGTGNIQISAKGFLDGEYSPWVITGTDVACTGNIEYLLDYATVEAGNHPTMASYCFANMFYNCTALSEAPSLPATTLAQFCYSKMFYGCKSLLAAPVLPATTLATNSYYYMFKGCTSLRNAPVLPATTLAHGCYSNMFSDCTSLREAPALPATTLAYSCYSNMFSDCTSLRVAPLLPATTLAEYCYNSMFSGCTSLIDIPVLPATTLVKDCYSYMFSDCTGIKLYTSADENEPFPKTWSIPAGANADDAYDWNSGMFYGTGGDFTGDPVIGTTYHYKLVRTPFVAFSSATSFTINAPKKWNGTLEYSTDGETWAPYEGGTALTAVQIVDSGDYYLCFRGTGNTEISGSSDSGSSPWVITGTAVACNGNIENLLDYTTVAANNHPTMEDYCFSKMFYNCKALTTAPSLPMTALAGYCYEYMFYGCTALRNAPELPATTLAPYCYQYMFRDCSSLRNAPVLQATTMTSGCYYYMFYNCTSLSEAPALPATTLASYCYYYMFRGCSSLIEVPALPATTLRKDCYYSMFSLCVGIKLYITAEGIDGFPKVWGIPEGTNATGAYNWNSSMLYGTGGGFTGDPDIGTSYYYSLEETPFIFFSSATSFTINATKKWNGTLEYSTDGTTWATYEGGTAITAAQIGGFGNYYLCFRGTGNTQISATGSNSGEYSPWVITGTDVTCEGNIEYLLDYATVDAGDHPTMADYCFAYMFNSCTALRETPELPATTMKRGCYQAMFSGCTALRVPSLLPATTLADDCYNSMFYGCTGIKLYRNTEQFDGFSVTWSIPEGANTENALGWNSSMFSGTGGGFTGDPAIDTSYYYSLEETPFIVFSSATPFTINATKKWGGTLEYSTDGVNWVTYDGGADLAAVQIGGAGGNYYLCFRGVGNTQISATGLGTDSYSPWVINGTAVACTGNIECLLDYRGVEAGDHPKMANYCFVYMFKNCTALIKAPALPATTLTSYCYYSMFIGCTSLSEAPVLPATTLATSCYSNMFSNCTSLSEAPALPATTLASGCYEYMFYKCTSLREAPALPATTLVTGCYKFMFYKCTSLRNAPVLPATTLASSCYYAMFMDCTYLKEVPVLPATTLTSGCYYYMFFNCSGIKLYNNADGAGDSPVAWSIPAEAAAGDLTNWNTGMFSGTGGSFTGDPAVGTTYYYSVPVSCLEAASDATTVDALNGIIYTNINASTDISDIVTPFQGYTVSVTPSLVGSTASYNGTGSVITVTDGTEEIDTYLLVVIGDVNGDSVCDAIDCMSAELVMNNHTTLTSSYLKAADYDSNASISIADFQQLMNCSLSK